MRMYAFKLKMLDHSKCEHCGLNIGDWGVVSVHDINTFNGNDLTKRDAAEALIWDYGIGSIMCSPCLMLRTGRE